MNFIKNSIYIAIFSSVTLLYAEDIETLKTQANKGDSQAQYELGLYYLKNLKDPLIASIWLKKRIIPMQRYFLQNFILRGLV